jgi:acetyltransferase
MIGSPGRQERKAWGVLSVAEKDTTATPSDAGAGVSYGHQAVESYRHPLDAFFAPRAVAVIGASDRPGSVGRTILWNLISSPFGGTVYAVNPKRHNVLGIRAYPDVASLPEPIDLAMIIIPATSVPGVIEECIAAGVKGAIILSAGFSETGEAGRVLEEQIRLQIRPNRIRLIGPNSLGIMNPVIGLNAAFASTIAEKGSVGFITQSGALGAAILDWSFQVKAGFSRFVAFGSMVDLGWADLIYYLGNDPNTKSIVIYMQSIGDARSFLSAAREVALNKPIILLKAGQTEEGARVARSTPYYAAADTCSDEVLTAAMRRSGVLRVNDIERLFAMAEVLGKQPRPRGPRLTILSNAAGPSILATDALMSSGGQLASLSESTLAELNALLPPYWNRNNPIDILADANPERYARSAEIALRDENTDGLLIVLTPQVLTDPTRTAEAIAQVPNPGRKPVLASWMGGSKVAAGEVLLNNHNIPVLAYPDTAARVFNAMWRYSYNLRGLYETPLQRQNDGEFAANRAAAKNVIEFALRAGQKELSPSATRDVLASYGIVLMETHTAHDETQAIHVAKHIGYPVVMKRIPGNASQTGDPGGVLLNLHSEDAVRRAFQSLLAFHQSAFADEIFHGVSVQPVVPANGCEVILGSSIDPQFGPYLYFGAGGRAGCVFRDRSVGLPPLTSTLARRMMEQTRIYGAIKDGRTCGCMDLEELEHLLVRFSYLVCEQNWVREAEINPLMLVPGRMVALEARIRLHDITTPPEAFPKLAIRPYPSEYTFTWTARDGREVTFRPIRPEDEAMMVLFHQTLSSDTVYFRYFRIQPLDQRIQHERLTELCFIDFDRGVALVALDREPDTGEPRILAVGRIVKIHGTDDADFAIMVSDLVQHVGLGTELLRRLIQIARTERIKRLLGTILPDNRAMLRLCSKLGFVLRKPVGEDVIAEMVLQ